MGGLQCWKPHRRGAESRAKTPGRELQNRESDDRRAVPFSLGCNPGAPLAACHKASEQPSPGGKPRSFADRERRTVAPSFDRAIGQFAGRLWERGGAENGARRADWETSSIQPENETIRCTEEFRFY